MPGLSAWRADQHHLRCGVMGLHII